MGVQLVWKEMSCTAALLLGSELADVAHPARVVPTRMHAAAAVVNRRVVRDGGFMCVVLAFGSKGQRFRPTTIARLL
jgi:hypothetical protein